MDKTIIYFKNEAGDHHKLEIEPNVSTATFDAFLDQLLDMGNVTYITEEEFDCPEGIEIDIMDYQKVVKLGTLTCKNFLPNIKTLYL